jgi:purine-cytosine permease-like protein
MSPAVAYGKLYYLFAISILYLSVSLWNIQIMEIYSKKLQIIKNNNSIFKKMTFGKCSFRLLEDLNVSMK